MKEINRREDAAALAPSDCNAKRACAEDSWISLREGGARARSGRQ